jgi:polyisoprenoid-binding protein YceI
MKKRTLAAIGASSFIALIALLAVGIGFIGLQGSFGGEETKPRFGDCDVQDGSDLSCNWVDEQIESFQGSGFGFTSNTITPENSVFTAQVDEAHVFDEDDYDDVPPIVPYLARNGYTLDSTDQDKALADYDEDHVNTSTPVLKSLENASSCRLTADIASHGEIRITTTQVEQEYNDEPDEPGVRHTRYLMPDPVTQQAESINVASNGKVYCQFNFTEMMNKGMELDGKFQEWDGRLPVAGDEVGSSGQITVDLEIDSDSDGTIDYYEPNPEDVVTYPENNSTTDPINTNETENTDDENQSDDSDTSQPDNGSGDGDSTGFIDTILNFFTSLL